MPVAYQGVNRFSNAVALLVSGRVLALRQIADTLIETGFVTGSRQGNDVSAAREFGRLDVPGQFYRS